LQLQACVADHRGGQTNDQEWQSKDRETTAALTNFDAAWRGTLE
jgi:hypothetical protein